MPNYRRLFAPGATYFFTVVTHNRRPILDGDTARRCLRNAIREVQASHPFDLLAVALMPDHIHCIWRMPEDDSDFSTRWSCIKRKFTRSWLDAGGQEVAISKARSKHRERGVWQKRFWEHMIRDQADLFNHVNYIHYNPVKHGLVKCPHEWPLSSFARWVREGYYSTDWLCSCDSQVEHPDFTEVASSVGE